MSLLFALFTLVHQTNSQPTLPPPDKVVITVNGHPITAKQVEAYLWDWNAVKVGQTLAVFEAIRQEAAKHGIVLLDAAVKAGVSMQIQQGLARAPKGTSVDDYLKQSGISRSEIEFGVRAQMLLKQLANGEFKPADYYKVATLVVKPKSESGADVQASLTSAGTAYSELLKGDAWEKVLTQTATDPQNMQTGGELGWIDIAQFPPTTQAEIPTLKVGGITKPVQTPNGIQIFRLEGRGKDATADELKQLRDRYDATAAREIFERIRNTSKIVNSF